MPLIELFKKFRDKYMRSAVDKLEFPDFPPDVEKRYRIIFSGVVQGVGFRYEVWLIAQKLGLTGFAENLSNGDVRMEVQGPENKIFHLIHCLESIPRIQIQNKKMEKLDLVMEETGFTPVY